MVKSVPVKFSKKIADQLLSLGFELDNSENMERKQRESYRFYINYGAVIVAVTAFDKFVVDAFCGSDFDCFTYDEKTVFNFISELPRILDEMKKVNSVVPAIEFLEESGTSENRNGGPDREIKSILNYQL